MRWRVCLIAGAALCVAVVVAAGLSLFRPGTGAAGPRVLTRSEARAEYARLPLSFVANRGQAPRRFRYVESGSGLSVGLGDGQVELALAQRSGTARRTVGLAVQTPGGHLGRPAASAELPGRANYFISDDRNRWVRNAATFARVSYQNVWPGVSVSFDGRQGVLEYDVRLSPGADPNRVALAFAGARSIAATRAGGAILTVPGGHLDLNAPHASQDGRTVASRLTIADGHIGFTLGAYDHHQPLLIDPNVSYATFVGGSGDDNGNSIAVDSSGDAYVTGSTSGSFPTTTGVDQTNAGGNGDAFVTKLNPSGSAVAYSTYLGGSGTDAGYGIAVDPSGDAYVTGTTEGAFPTTFGAAERTYGGGDDDAFVTELNPDGSDLVYSTYLGGNGDDKGNRIAVDASGEAYVTGDTNGGFPTTAGAEQTSSGGGVDAFVTKLNASGSALAYSTYLGGSGTDVGFGIAVDPSGDAYVTGDTDGGFPTTAGAEQTSSGGDYDAFVTKLNASGSALDYSTYLGGSGTDTGYEIAVDPSGDGYITGDTTGGFPTTAGAEQTSFGGDYDAFVTKLNPSGSALAYSTYLGGSGDAHGYAVAVDASGEAYVTGYTMGSFPTTAGAEQTTNGGGIDAFVTKLNAGGSALAYSTYLGGSGTDIGYGIAVDPSGDAYVTGDTNGGFPTTAGAEQTSSGGDYDAFVTRLVLPSPSCQALASTVPHNEAVTVTLTCSDPNTTVTGLSVVSGPAHGTLGALNQGGGTATVTYTPTTGYSGIDTFTFDATSANGTSTPQTATLTVASAPAPTCSDSSLSVNRGTSSTLTLSCEADGDPLSLAIVSGPSHGTLGTVSGDSVSYTPASGYSGSDAVSYRATDTASGQTSTTATVHLTVLSEAPAPTTTSATKTTHPTAKVEQVNCLTRTVRVKHRLVRRTTCTTKLVIGTATLKIRGPEHATLSRGRTTEATGTISQRGQTQTFVLRSARHLPAGRYTLSIIKGRRVISRRTVTLRSA